MVLIVEDFPIQLGPIVARPAGYPARLVSLSSTRSKLKVSLPFAFSTAEPRL